MESLLQSVAIARHDFIASVSGLSKEQATFRPSPEGWSITDITEHMFWAEFGAINGMWKALESVQQNNPLFKGEAVHYGLPVEQIIEKTWREKEDVPETAKPRWGGSLEFWITSLLGLQIILEKFNKALGDVDPQLVIHPHPISGPMDIIQRMEFLRFHLKRHQGQVEQVKKSTGFGL